MKFIRVWHFLLVKYRIYALVVLEVLITVLLECFLDLVAANLDYHPIRTVVVSVLPTSQKRVAYRIIGSNSIISRCASRLASAASTLDMRIICTKHVILSLAVVISWDVRTVTLLGGAVIITRST